MYRPAKYDRIVTNYFQKDELTMDKRRKTILSIVLKIIIFLFVTVGIVFSLMPNGGSEVNISVFIKYFTTQINIFVGICSLILALKQIKLLKAGRYELSHTAEVIHLMSTSSITLTGLTFLAVILSAVLSGSPETAVAILTPQQIIPHILVPVLSIIDFLVFTRPVSYTFSGKDFLWSVIPPLYYIGFSRVGYVMKWDFGGGKNYPYFFLNYDFPFFKGVFWWILAILVVVLLISVLYTAIVNKAVKRYTEKLI